MSLPQEPKKSFLELLADKNREMEAGHIVERHYPDGSVEMVNELDEMVDKKKKEAREEEKQLRYKNHTTIMVVLGLVVIIVLLVMAVFWINMSPSFTGVYFDRDGNKIELYHNKSLGNFDIVNNKGNRSGVFKKITGKYYGLYLNDDLLLESMENANEKKMVAYIETDTHNIIWKNDMWIPDHK